MSTINEIFSFKGNAICKLLVIMFAALMCLVLVIISTDDSVGEEDFNFISNVIEGTDTAEITGYDGPYSGGQLSTPLKVTIGLKSYTVTSIADDAFKGHNELVSVYISENVMNIGDGAFSDCNSLRLVIIPDHIMIGTDAFKGCTNLISLAFYGDVLTDYTSLINKLPDNISTIGINSGASVDIEKITALEHITIIGFTDESAVTVPTGITFKDFNGMTITDLRGKVFEADTRTTWNQICTVEPSDPNIKYYFDWTKNTAEVKYLYNSDVTDVIIDSYVINVGVVTKLTSIGDSVFVDCTNLKELIIPDGVTSIGNNAFSGCSDLTTITIPDSIDFIGNNAFSDCTFYSPDGINELPKTVSGLKGHTYSEVGGKKLVQLINIMWFVDEFSDNKTVTLAFDTMPVYETDPTKKADVVNTYTFAGWTPTIVKATVDTTYTAVFSSTPKVYVISWIIDDVTTTEPLNYGDTPVHEDPTKTSTDKFTFNFTGWGPSIVDVTGDKTYIAQFSKTTNKYTIIFNDGASNVFNESLDHGTLIPAQNEPTKDADAQYASYTFNEWKTISNVVYTEGMSVSEDMTFNAVFIQGEVRSYIITWIIGEFTDVMEVPYGDMPSYDNTLIVDQYTYTIIRWDVVPVVVTGPAKYTAVFDSVLVCETTIGIIENSVFEDPNNESLTINVMNGNELAYSWTFTGSYNIDAGTFNPDIEAMLDEDLNAASSSTENKDHLILKFASSGILPKNALVSYYVGNEYEDGIELLLFFYNKFTKQLEDQFNNMIVTDGFVTFNLTHCPYCVSDLFSDATDNTMLYVGVVVAVTLISIVAVVLLRFDRRL